MRLIAFVLVLNFAAFIASSLWFGGDALNGDARSGHFFVCAHGGCNDVSPGVWKFNYWHGWTAMGGILLMLIGGAIQRNRQSP